MIETRRSPLEPQPDSRDQTFPAFLFPYGVRPTSDRKPSDPVLPRSHAAIKPFEGLTDRRSSFAFPRRVSELVARLGLRR